MKTQATLAVSTALVLTVCLLAQNGSFSLPAARAGGDGPPPSQLHRLLWTDTGDTKLLDGWWYVFPPDDRDLINSNAYPWSAVCKVFVTFKDGSGGEGSAAMVGKRLAITAGHVVYDSDHGGYARTVRLVPRFDDGYAPFGSHYAARLYALDEWRAGEDAADLGAIELGSDVGSSTGVFRLRFESVTADATTLNIAGYPGDRQDGEDIFHSTGTALAVEDEQLFYADTLDTYSGQSGAPIWIEDGEDLVLVGVHAGALEGVFNVGTRLNEDRVTTVRDWGGINTAPVLVEGPTADHSITAVGQSVQFAVGVTDADGDDISISWDFGDGASATGPSPRHTYDRTGTFTATVTADDGYETTDGECQVEVHVPLTGIGLRIKLNFRRRNRDSFRLSCCMPVSDVDPGDPVTVDIGGVTKTYILGRKLSARTATGKAKVRYDGRRDCWTLKVREKRGDFRSDWVDEGLENRDLTSVGLEMATHLQIGHFRCAGVTLHDYRSRTGKRGRLW